MHCSTVYAHFTVHCASTFTRLLLLLKKIHLPLQCFLQFLVIVFFFFFWKSLRCTEKGHSLQQKLPQALARIQKLHLRVTTQGSLANCGSILKNMKKNWMLVKVPATALFRAQMAHVVIMPLMLLYTCIQWNWSVASLHAGIGKQGSLKIWGKCLKL